MGNFIQLDKIEAWRLKLGLLPVPLFDGSLSQASKYVLLNGQFGNFCLDIKGNEQESFSARNYAWSSDVGHYVNILDKTVEIYRWDKQATSLERYKRENIERNLEQFYMHLQKNQPRRELSIIPFIMNIFRRLRGALSTTGIDDGQKALNALLYLLACSSDKVDRDQLSIAKWQLDKEAHDVANNVRPGDWDELMRELIEGVTNCDLQPNISLLLRHASGQLFQEAHYIANAKSLQLTFDGLPRSAVVNKKRNIENIRKHSGVYYTPTSIVRTLVEEALAAIVEVPPSFTVFDPACGSGEFLKEILRQLSLINYKGRINLVGWDNSEAAVNITRFVLAREIVSSNVKAFIQIDLKNSLIESNNWPGNVDLVLMNPPFLSWEDMDKGQQEIARRILGSLLEKRPDQASLFVYKAIQSLRKGGVLSTILPASIFDADSYRQFRGEMASTMAAHLIGKLGSQALFTNAQVDAAIYVGKFAEKRDLPTTTLWADHRLESASAALRKLRQLRTTKAREVTLVDESAFSIYPNQRIGTSSDRWAARSYKSYRLFTMLESFSRVKDFFTIMQGARTGNKPVFIISKDELNNLPIAEKKYFRPAVVNESIKEGFLNESAYVFYPYGEKLPQLQTEDDLKKNVKTYFENHLLPFRDNLMRRARKDEHNWWLLSEYRAWQKEKRPKLISTFFGKAGYFAWDNTGDFVVVQGHCWIPNSSFIKKFNTEVGLAYLAILCSPVIDRLLSYVSVHLGGGQWDLSQKYVHDMPLPDLFNKELDIHIFEKLVNIGRSISQNKKYDDDALKQLTLNLYNIPPDLELFDE